MGVEAPSKHADGVCDSISGMLFIQPRQWIQNEGGLLNRTDHPIFPLKLYRELKLMCVCARVCVTINLSINICIVYI